MGRVIKFRVWVKKDKHMTENFRIGTNINDSFKSDNVVFMQFTGLKDSNDVDIYEGDIVRIWHCDEGSDDASIGKVAWISSYYPAFDVYIPSDSSASGFESYHDEYNSFSYSELIIEVIGNIHENPELLEDK